MVLGQPLGGIIKTIALMRATPGPPIKRSPSPSIGGLRNRHASLAGGADNIFFADRRDGF